MSELDESNRQFIAAWQYYARKLNGTIDDRDGVSVAFSNVMAPIMNMAFLSSPIVTIADFEQRLARAVEVGTTSGCMWMFTVCEDWLPPDVKKRAHELLDEAKLTVPTPTTGMVADGLKPPRRPPPKELVIRPARDQAGYQAISDINLVAYHMPLEWGAECLARPEIFTGDIWADVGYVDEVAVSTSTTVLLDGILYVMLVATEASHYNKGYAEAVMRSSLERAMAATGVTRTVLHATNAGRPLYTSMGYRDTGAFTMYMQPPPGM